MKYSPLGLPKISPGLCLSLPKLDQARAWHHHALMIKYQGTPLDILLVQQDGWNGQNKAGCVYSLSHQRLPFFFPSRPLWEVCIRKAWWISFLTGDFQCWKGNIFFFVPDAPALLPLCLRSLSLLFLSTPFFAVVLPQISVWRINHLQQRVSAVLECGVLFVICSGPSMRLLVSAAQCDAVNWGGSRRASLADPRSPGPHRFSSQTLHAHYLTCQVVEAMGCGTWTCLAAGVSWVFLCKGIRATETLLERKRKDRCASSWFFRSLTLQHPGVPSGLLSSLGHARRTPNPDWEQL